MYKRQVRTLPLGGGDELAQDLIAVGAAGILGAEGDLPLGAGEPLAHAAHVHADGLRHPGGDAGGAAVAHLLIDRHEMCIRDRG